jgi:hypothetical protein
VTKDVLRMVRFDTNGHLEIDGVSIPTVKIVFTKEPSSAPVLEATIPLLDFTELSGQCRVVYVTEWSGDGQPRLIWGQGHSPLEALRDVVRQLELPR